MPAGEGVFSEGDDDRGILRALRRLGLVPASREPADRRSNGFRGARRRRAPVDEAADVLGPERLRTLAEPLVGDISAAATNLEAP